ncbi:RNA polymerase sigma factor OS=Streptomyces fumanus OX=67302 GN=GCM10018772_25760 PE=3 SV=1 [Streptomyces fumanus]
MERTPAATRQLASRARRRVRDATPAADPDLGRQRAALDAFLAASRAGDFEALLAVLHPDVVLRADAGAGLSRLVRGARTVAEQARLYQRTATAEARPVTVNGAAGLLAVRGGRPESVLTVTVVDGRITGLYILADPERLARLELPGLDT